MRDKELWELDTREWKADQFEIVAFYGYETHPARETVLAKLSFWGRDPEGNPTLKDLFNDLYRKCVNILGGAPCGGDDNKVAIEVLDKENNNQTLYVCYYDFTFYVATELRFPYNEPRRIEIREK